MAAKRVKVITTAELATLPGMAEATAKAEGKTNEGVTSMATNTPTPAEQLAALVAEVEDMLTRLNPLATGGEEGFTPLHDEADEAISAIPTKLKGATAEKKRLRTSLGDLKDTYGAAVKAAEASTGVVVLGTQDWHEVISDDEFKAAVKDVKDAVSLHLKSGEAAKQVSAHLLDARLKVRDKKGNVDLRGNSQVYRDYASSVYAQAGEALGIEDNAENREVLGRLQSSTGYYMSDRVVTFARELTAEDFAEKFPQVAEAHEGLDPFAALVAEKIVPEKSKREAAIERQQAKALEAKAAEAAESSEGDEGEGESAPAEEDVLTAALKASTALLKATTHMVQVPVGVLDNEHRAELEENLKLVAAKIAEVRKALIVSE